VPESKLVRSGPLADNNKSHAHLFCSNLSAILCVTHALKISEAHPACNIGRSWSIVDDYPELEEAFAGGRAGGLSRAAKVL